MEPVTRINSAIELGESRSASPNCKPISGVSLMTRLAIFLLGRRRVKPRSTLAELSLISSATNSMLLLEDVTHLIQQTLMAIAMVNLIVAIMFYPFSGEAFLVV